MNNLQAREQKAIIEELEKDIEGKKEDLYILENFVEFKTKKDGNLYQNLTRNLGDNMKIEYSFISPSEINYIEVGGRINIHYYKNVRIYNDRDKENLTDSEKIELIKKLIEDRKIALRNQIEQYTKELTTVAERLTRITELVDEFNESLNNENLVTFKDKYLIEEYIKNSIKIKTKLNK